jgi:hypothetical protein
MKKENPSPCHLKPVGLIIPDRNLRQEPIKVENIQRPVLLAIFPTHHYSISITKVGFWGHSYEWMPLLPVIIVST